MTINNRCCFIAPVILAILAPLAIAQEKPATRFQLKDIFDLEYASDPQIAPDGKRVVYVRNSFDIMTDRRRGKLWIVDTDGKNHRPVTAGKVDESVPRWSPDGKRLAYVTAENKKPVLICRWMDTGQTATLAQLNSPPKELAWSPDGNQIAFSMFVPEKPKPFVKLPQMPKNAKWAAPPKVIARVNYRIDGIGYLKHGYFHVFVVPADGGTPRQITTGPYHHRGSPSWTPEGKKLIYSANRKKDWEYHHPWRESEVYEVALKDGKSRQLTKRKGPDTTPIAYPAKEANLVAYVGFDNRFQGYQKTGLYILDRKTGFSRPYPTKLDRSVRLPVWRYWVKTPTGGYPVPSVYFLFDDLGVTKVGRVPVSFVPKKNLIVRKTNVLVENVGGTTIGRPYASGTFSVSAKGVVACPVTGPNHPADVAVYDTMTRKQQRLTHLNDDLFAHKKLGSLEEIWFKSSHDGRKIQGWILKPPGFDPKKKYPLILEIHGGPFANYGPRFSAEMQLYAAAGYVVFYCNPRGSTSYGEEFGNLIHHAYPGHDYDDLMSGVDAVINKGYIDTRNLFVTGGSGGGVLTAWIIGRTNRFRAAVVGKPVINWFSFALTSDIYAHIAQYWFPGSPWEKAEHYFKRSPISLVGNVNTPAMILTGEEDHRTPMSQSEEYYQALKLRKIETVLVRIPGASHNIAARPSQLIAKVACVLKWFEDHRRR